MIGTLLKTPHFYQEEVTSIRYALGKKLPEDAILSFLPSELPMQVKEKLVSHARTKKRDLNEKELAEIFTTIAEAEAV